MKRIIVNMRNATSTKKKSLALRIILNDINNPEIINGKIKFIKIEKTSIVFFFIWSVYV